MLTKASNDDATISTEISVETKEKYLVYSHSSLNYDYFHVAQQARSLHA